MNMFNRLSSALLVGAFLLSVSTALRADEIQDANKLFKQGKQSQALDIVNNYLADKPKDAQARFLKGLIFTDQGKTNDAIKIFSALTEDYPELPEPYNNMAVLYASQGQYDKAKIALEMAIRTHPSYATAHENLGDIYAKLASQAYDRALQLDRSNTSTQTKLAMIQELFASDTHGKTNATRTNPIIASTAALTKPAPAASSPEPVELEPANPEPVESKIEAVAPAPNEKDKDSVPIVNNRSEVLNTVNAWAAAWSAKNVNKYLSFYANDFKTSHGESRTAWEAARRQRISAPKTIHVVISKAVVTATDDTHATVKFHQLYQAGHLKITGNKALYMVQSGSAWLIQEERN